MHTQTSAILNWPLQRSCVAVGYPIYVLASINGYEMLMRIKMCLITRKKCEILVLVKALMHRTVMRLDSNRNPRMFSLLDQIPGQIRNMRDLVEWSDEACKNMLRMDRLAFVRLCTLLQSVGGLRNSRHVSIQEKVAMIFTILAHHTNNRSVKFQFRRSGQTVSKHFHGCLGALDGTYIDVTIPTLDKA
ncbi:hypothetical protein ACS0TY_023318 [Phlomoides rotata]